MVKLYQPGDKSRAVCPHCAKLVTTTFNYRDVPFDDGSGTVRDILTAVCDECAQVVAVPAQSTPAIRNARDVADISLEVSIPAPEVEILDAAAYRIDPRATTRFRKSLFAYYLSKWQRETGALDHLGEDVMTWLTQRQALSKQIAGIKIPKRRISFKLSPATNQNVHKIMDRTNLDKTKLMRGVIMMTEREILSDEPGPVIRELQEIAAIVNA